MKRCSNLPLNVWFASELKILEYTRDEDSMRQLDFKTING